MKRRMSRALVGAASLVAVGCAVQPPHTANGAPVAPLVVHRVEWNVNHVPVANVRAVADDGGVVAVLTDRGASVFSAGALAATDTKAEGWTSASVIPGADGAPRWIVGVDSVGRVDYLRNLTEFETVSPRYGLEGARVRSVVALGGASVAFVLDRELAIADGKRVTHYATAPLSQVAGGGGTLVGVATDAVQVFRTTEKTGVSFPLPGVLAAAVGADGKVYAATSAALYASDGFGGLSLVYRAATGIHGLVVSGTRVWFADGTELGVLDGGSVAETKGAHVAKEARLASSLSGDVWVLEGGGAERYQAAIASVSEQAEWAASIAPVFARACSSCHLPDGRAGVDLSTPVAWSTRRGEITQRVLVSKTMPPYGAPFSEADRAVVKAWADAHGGH